MAAYYNENDRFAAAWLRELIKEGLIADGEVDERDIRDVEAADLRGFTQCHFFAGIGGWSYALRLAGWPDDRPVWTGSCPCQPFSSAGKGEGGADDRHLWPHWARLIRECQPVTIFGEQVESAIAHGWIDAVFDDLEREGYACGAACLPAASVGAFHRRQRLWFVAESSRNEWRTRGLSKRSNENSQTERRESRIDFGSCRSSGELAESDGRNSEHGALQRRREHGLRTEDRHADGAARITERTQGELADDDGSRCRARRASEESNRRDAARVESSGLCVTGVLGHAESPDWQVSIQQRRPCQESFESGRTSGVSELGQSDSERETQARGFPRRTIIERERSPWADAEWIACRDGKSRPVEPGTFPLAHGLPSRVGRLRGYGNAIVPQVAAAFIQAYCDARELK